MSKAQRHALIREIVRRESVASQEHLRELLEKLDCNVAQATLSRDVRDLRLVKVHDADGGHHYTLPPESREESPDIARLLPALFISAEGGRNLLVVKTLAGGAQAVAKALDAEEWPEVLGTLAGDDTILIILRDDDLLPAVKRRIATLASA
jgi:transcriptional regulator of arginine metabolism